MEYLARRWVWGGAEPLPRLEADDVAVPLVASVYAVVGWVVLQVAKILVDALFLPPASLTAILVLVLLGFPVAMVVTWLYDLTPEGVERTSVSEADAPPRDVRGGVLAVLMAATLLATAGAGWASWRVWLGPSAAAGSDVDGPDAGPELDPARLAAYQLTPLEADAEVGRALVEPGRQLAVGRDAQ